MTKEEVSSHVGALLVYQSMVARDIEAGRSAEARTTMRWYNDHARKLNAAGYGNVALYNI